MRKSLSFKEKMMLLIMTIIIALGMTYWICSLTLAKSIAKVRQENKSLKEQYKELETYVVNKDFYISETKTNTDTTMAIIKSYVNNVNDKTLLYDFDRYLEEYNFETNSLALADNTLIGEVSLGEETYKLQTNTLSLPISFKYEDFIRFITDIRDKDMNLAISNISILPENKSNGEDGEATDEKRVSGTFTINKNLITGSSDELKDPEYDFEKGIEYIFD